MKITFNIQPKPEPLSFSWRPGDEGSFENPQDVKVESKQDASVTPLWYTERLLNHSIIDVTPTSNSLQASTFSFVSYEDREVIPKQLADILQKRRSTALPNCLRSRAYADFYTAFIEYYLSNEVQQYEHLSKMIFSVGSIQNANDESLVSRASKILNAPRLITALSVGDYIGVKPEHCFHRYPVKVGVSANKKKFETTFPPKTIVGQSVWVLKETYPIKRINGDVDHSVCIFSNGKDEVIAYADEDMRFGYNCLAAIPPSTDILDENPCHTVHFCLCPDTTQIYLKRAREEHLAKHADVVVTGCFGGAEELESLDLSCLSFRPVTLICSPDREEWKGVESLAKRCQEHGAESVKIFPWPLELN